MAAASLRERAIRLLAQREHSRAELARKLAGHGSPEEVEATLDRMTELDLLSDTRFAQAWVRSKAGRFGIARLRHDLARRGVDRELIDEALAAECTSDEMERAREVWSARFGKAAADRREWGRQARFLEGRGFSRSVIGKLLKEIPDEPA